MAEASETVGPFTVGETKLIMCLIKHLKGDLPSDFDAVAQELGYKNSNIVKTRWGQIKRKRVQDMAVTAKKVTPRKRKGKMVERANAEDDDDEKETPKLKKTGRSKPSKAKATEGGVKTEQSEDDVKKEESDDEEMDGMLGNTKVESEG